jgi:transglutaminase-like putative cysteine protease
VEKVVVIGDLVNRALGWIIRWLGARTLLSLALLLVALGSVALGLTDVIRGLDAGLVLPAAVSGVLLGWVLAKSPLPGWLGGALAFILGAAMILVRVGHLGAPLVALLRSLADLAWEISPLGGRPPDSPPDGSSVTLALVELETGVGTLLTRVRDWALALTRGEPGFDPVATALVWSLVLGMAAVWAGWALRRRDWTLQGIAPAGALLAISLVYAGGHPYPLLPLLGATWLLMALTEHDVNERRWQATRTDVFPDVRLELGLAATLISLGLVATAMLAPSVSVQSAYRFAQRLIVEHLGEGEQVADSLGLEPGAGPTTVFEHARAAGLPRRHLLGAGAELSQQVVMVVYPEGDAQTDEVWLGAGSRRPVPRYYWRSFTYDRYTGRGWYTVATVTLAYQAGERADFGAAGVSPRPDGSAEPLNGTVSATSTSHRTLRQEVRAVGDLGGLLHVAGELLTADQDYRVAWRSPGDPFGAEIEATVYRADSLVPIVSEAGLRATEGDYPQWVRERYLALPDNVPARVLALARDLTALEPTSYDRARVIEDYLRAFPYTLDLPAPPPGRDVADYFLFDLQQGYCDYYATAMVVLARAAGLPARLVVGYASGSYDATHAGYVVTEADAHSWAEVYFPSYGWVEFEPTGGRPPIERPAEPAPLEIPEPRTPLEPITGRRIGSSRLLWLGLLGGLAFLALGSVAWWVTDGWRLRRLPPPAAVAALYQRLLRHGRRLAVPALVGDTPYEFAAGLAGEVAELARERRWGAALAATPQEVRRLTDLYVRGLYSPHDPNVAEQAQAIKAWQRLRWPLWLAWLWQKAGRMNE